MVIVESLDQDCRGVAHFEGKAIFIDGALPGERVSFNSYRKKSTYELAKLDRVMRSSPSRVSPRCPHFGVCGGCSLQHLDFSAQVASKQRILEDNLQRIGKVNPETILPAIYGPDWEYRYRARFSVRYIEKKGGVLVGFHEKHSSFVADMNRCEVVPRRISELLPKLRTVIGELSIYNRIPQLELAIGEAFDAFVLRTMEPLSSKDEDTLKNFADRYKIHFYLQPAGPDSVYRFYPENAPELSYSLPEFNLTLTFGPTDFTQVNYHINRTLVGRAIKLLQPGPGERVADMFCGLGNFGLAIARSGADVTGIEGNKGLIERARENALRNGLKEKAKFFEFNLFNITERDLNRFGTFDKMLIDPPRDGAVELIKAIDTEKLKRIVYVSCNPATLARDADALVHSKAYQLRAAGVVNMFPHTTHIESIALFESGK